MTKEEVIDFLRLHQPLPKDDELSRVDLEKLESVRQFLLKHPNADALDLLLGVFGEGSAFGVYQLLDEAVAAHDPSDVVPALIKKLESGPGSVRYWCALLAGNYPDERLVPVLAACLATGELSVRDAAVTSLVAIGSHSALSALREWLPNEADEEIREIINSIG